MQPKQKVLSNSESANSEEIIGEEVGFIIKLKESLRSKPGKWSLGVLAILLISGAFIIFNLLFKNNEPESKAASSLPITPSSPTPLKIPNPYNGLPTDPELAKRRAVAVMIENHPDARPQAGLSQADIIYEAVTEGGITRFLAIFAISDPQKVGPVRSARTHFLPWVKEIDAVYAHVGGSADGLENIKAFAIKDLDQFANPSPYWREKSKNVATEHTMYVNIEKLRGLFKSKNWSEAKPDFESWDFEDDIALSERPESGEEIIPYEGVYKVNWRYQKETNSYLRINGGVVAKDSLNDQQITAKNVIVLKMQTSQFVNSAGKKVAKVTYIGSGNGFILKNGQKIEIVWKKPSLEKRLNFYTPEGQKVALVRGVIWIEILPI